MATLAILGSGIMATALTTPFTDNGHEVRLVGTHLDRDIIDAHLAAMAPLIEEGGFIPTVDHTVPPDVPLDNFRYYIERKQRLLRGEG